MRSNDEVQNWRSKAVETVPEEKDYNSPPYTKRRDLVSGRDLRRAPKSQRSLGEWRVKAPGGPLSTENLAQTTAEHLRLEENNTQRQSPLAMLHDQTEEQVLEDLNEATRRYLSCPDPTEAAARRQRVLAGDARGQTEEMVTRLTQVQRSITANSLETPTHHQNRYVQTKEQVIQELQETTLQYLSCADPVEAAARRQRVLASDAEGLMETTANSILAAAAEQRRPLSPWERGIRSESPPGIDFDLAMQVSDVEVTPPPKNTALDIQLQEATSRRDEPYPKGLRSIIVSPGDLEEDGQAATDSLMDEVDTDENLHHGKLTKKVKPTRATRKHSPRLTPNILRGASSKKRKLSQIQQSPANGGKRTAGESAKDQRNQSHPKKVNRGVPQIKNDTMGLLWTLCATACPQKQMRL
ncbi:Uncharacterized protein Rs2_04398 [Raphanus sativus]|nr:Uncharacterized protein Rs2_04398 [Raphanus sativus]